MQGRLFFFPNKGFEHKQARALVDTKMRTLYNKQRLEWYQRGRNEPHSKTDESRSLNRILWSRIEEVITSLTRNQVVDFIGTWVRIPPTPLPLFLTLETGYFFEFYQEFYQKFYQKFYPYSILLFTHLVRYILFNSFYFLPKSEAPPPLPLLYPVLHQNSDANKSLLLS